MKKKIEVLGGVVKNRLLRKGLRVMDITTFIKERANQVLEDYKAELVGKIEGMIKPRDENAPHKMTRDMKRIARNTAFRDIKAIISEKEV